MIFHSTLSNIYGLAFLNQLKLDILSGKLPDLELMSFFEPHKHRQNSCTVLRKKGGLSARLYSDQPESEKLRFDLRQTEPLYTLVSLMTAETVVLNLSSPNLLYLQQIF